MFKGRHKKSFNNEELVTLSRQIIAGKLAATISHKAKNILMPLTGYAELIQSRVSQDKQKEYLKKIETSGRNLQILLKSFLCFSRPSPAREEEEIDLLTLAEDIFSLFEHYLTLARVSLEKGVIEGKAFGVYGDISLIFASVFLNAIEASPQGGKIKVATEVGDNKVNISIKDDGPGVKEEIRDKIFETFFSTKKGSLGLGLSASLFLVRGMSGDIMLEGENKFVISLCQKR